MTRSNSRRRLIPLFIAAALSAAACGDDGGSTSSVTFAEPADGATVHGSVELVMTAEGVTIEEAGEARDGAGHFHVLADQGCLGEGTTIGKDADTVHFGGGQTEGSITLGPGDHELCLQVGDGVHAALDITDTVSITVGISDRDGWCDVIGEVDELQAEVDAIEDFAAAQVGFENMHRLMAQLIDGIEFVDDDVRADFEAVLDFGQQINEVFVDAPDFDAAFAELEALYDAAGDDDVGVAGIEWVRDTCGVDLED